jgi:hypothetical protein
VFDHRKSAVAAMTILHIHGRLDVSATLDHQADVRAIRASPVGRARRYRRRQDF